ncbi:PocR ligand-binding domain-containing protein [Desulfitobacterium sp. Sab5]|uniref:PocR ligand-binding domain-containing protein n=1 Tax=Desulfitobacterium nosdiversum TaxID=3375356 RepID=UPI003CEBE6CF
MKYRFSELVNISNLQNFLEGLFSMSNPVFGIVDNDSNLIFSYGWQEICQKYHRLNSETALLCKQSDSYLKNHFDINKPYVYYTCANGLIDAATPIIIEGEHIATAIHGQFLFEEPDKEQFIRKAQKYGFDEEEYLKALAKVPIYPKEELDSIMLNMRQLFEMMARNGLNRLRRIESEKEKRLKTIIDNTPYVAIQSYDSNGRIRYCNQASETMFGWVHSEEKETTLDQPMIFEKCLDSDFGANLKSINETGRVIKDKEWIFKNKEGIEKTISSTLFPIDLPDGKKELISIDIDITEKKRFEKEMQRLDQLNLIGEMAAGIAHEIRNPLTTIRGYLQLIQNREEVKLFKSQFELMMDEIDRANSIISEFLSLAKTQRPETKKCDLNDIITKLFPLIQADAFTKSMEVIFEPGEISLVHLNAKEIHQLILNLCRNGLEAMKKGGCITLKTFREGQYVVLSVKDEGIGIPIENLDKLGKPFFSTKDNGTGLGLANCYNIATRHNAIIDINTSPGGTAFFIRFPCEEIS